MNHWKPLLAARLMPSDIEHTDVNILAEMQKLHYPVYATLKVDGIRGLRQTEYVLVSRTLKPIPNVHIRQRAMKLPLGFDMELFNPALQYDEIESIVMSVYHDCQEDIQFHVLDWYDDGTGTYLQRMNDISNCAEIALYKDVRFVPPIECNSPPELLEYFLKCEQEQGEGICFRDGLSKYIQKPGIENRSTLNEQILVKLCRYVTEEATIIGFEEQLCNTNSARRNAIGSMDRSSSQARLIGKDTLGAFIVKDKLDRTFRIGTGVGLTNKRRKEIWSQRDKYLGKQVTYKCKKHGEKLLPRSPIWKGFREDGY